MSETSNGLLNCLNKTIANSSKIILDNPEPSILDGAVSVLALAVITRARLTSMWAMQ